MNRHKLWIGGQWQEHDKGGSLHPLHSPFNGETVAQVDYASREQLEAAISASVQAFEAFRKVSRHARAQLLLGIADEIGKHRLEFTQLMAAEAGKPVTMADGEINRAIVTFTVAAEECKRFGGEIVPVDVEPTGRPFAPAISYWVPRGPVLGITPFNFPLNLVAHKVAPALAAGCSILIKPAPQAPGCATLLAQIFGKVAQVVSDARDKIPLAALQVVSCTNDVAAFAVRDTRLPSLSFTGSTRVGWLLQEQAIGKKITLELGGNAAVIVNADADLARAAARCAFGGFAYAGQSCISVQRIFVHKEVEKKFTDLLLIETEKTIAGDPFRKETLVGPMIDQAAATRAENWLEEARVNGVKILGGGRREKAMLSPTVLSGTGARDLRRLKVYCEEVFAPVVLTENFETLDEAYQKVNDSRFGLQAGIFTDSAKAIQAAIERLDVGGVIINEVPTFRADPMPYGGVKESGLGREGLRYAMEEYSERKTVVAWNG